jgi:hypothetical protein
MRRVVTLAMFLLLALGLIGACGKKNEPDPPGGPNSTYGRPYPRS